MNRFLVGSTSLGIAAALALAPSVGISQAAARGTKTVSFTATFTGPYACLGACVWAPGASDKGTARTSSSEIGTLTYVGAITEGVYDAKANCVPQQETLAFRPLGAKAGKDTFYIRTTNDKICFGKDPNVATETANFTIGGGSGRFAKAGGSGHFTIKVLTHPQADTGTMTATISY
jgi:hypothetical protein